MDPSLARRAAGQGGTFSRQDALAAGYSPAEIRSRLDTGSWLRLRRGRYVEAATLAGQPSDALASYRLKCWAALSAINGRAVVSHNSASLVDGLDLHPEANRRSQNLVELILPNGASRRRPGILGHDLPLAPDEQTELDGLPVTTLERTAVDVASIETPANALITVDSVLRRWRADGMTRIEGQQKLLEAAERWPRKSHRRITRTIAFADGLSESAGESLSRLELAGQGIQTPRLQYIVGDFRADFAWPEFRTLGEFDGRLKYIDPAILWAEKLREDALRDAGWELVRWTWAQTTRSPAEVASRVRRAFERGLLRAG